MMWMDETALWDGDGWAVGGPEHGDEFFDRWQAAHSLAQAVKSLFRPG
jgi:hypothetical protein